jgi:hypothetical protein
MHDPIAERNESQGNRDDEEAGRADPEDQRDAT